MGLTESYIKADPVNFGKTIGEIIVAVRGDGVGTHVLDELIAAFTASATAMNELKAVPEAAAEHILSGVTETMGDAALAAAIAAEAAAGDV